MRKPLKINLEDLRQNQLKDLFVIVEQVFAELEIEFYVLGAVARYCRYNSELFQY